MQKSSKCTFIKTELSTNYVRIYKEKILNKKCKKKNKQKTKNQTKLFSSSEKAPDLNKQMKNYEKRLVYFDKFQYLFVIKFQ